VNRHPAPAARQADYHKPMVICGASVHTPMKKVPWIASYTLILITTMLALSRIRAYCLELMFSINGQIWFPIKHPAFGRLTTNQQPNSFSCILVLFECNLL
jgi:hypothetical protein